MIRNNIHTILTGTLRNLKLSSDKLNINPPNNEDFGDFTTNIALQLAKTEKKNPMELAKTIVEAIKTDDIIEKVEILKPGFINVWISKNVLLKNLSESSQNIFSFKEYHLGKNKKVIVEYAHPNTHKLFHIGHLRNITTGETIARLLEVTGNTVIRANYQGDVGLHIAKTLWAAPTALDELGKEKINSMTIREKISLLGNAYVKGSEAYETSPEAKKEIIEINKQIYNQDGRIMPLYEQTRAWSLEYFDEKYERIGTTFDKKYFESQMAERSIELIEELVKKNILEKSDGAIIFNGEGHGVYTRVFLNKEGYPTYEGKELPLAEKETTDFGEVDKIIHVVTEEQTSFFATTFKVEELTDSKRYTDKQKHLKYGWVHLKGGKMSSRKGNVVEGEWLLDEAKKQIIKDYESTEEVAEKLAIAAVKYSFLKSGLQGDVYFDMKDATTLQGDSGPYLVYTYVRCKSVLNKSEDANNVISIKAEESFSLNTEELAVMRALIKYPEVVQESAQNFAPNYLCLYLYDLSQKYNLFYQKNSILKADNENEKNLRLAITQATAHVLKHGLNLLGIETVEKM
ncbi:arginine--tRNA ligase [Candidatus Roizmanbacteria bacterium CG_4_9_14_0_2_um_filter_39_13]|uniref:Arginine--tRNA ligase n=2 Tax=Candidatus Roizmaniibacteriota TaxID=1752723 RepID=A0A2M8EWL8_9BACT|nr:MAG: arginine--tRNA ligase [Candidatus Roizmanbacteria bacterium CG_4_10_14_0_2_um_filter_39_12]PJC30257.1 MAG: arginine--tRNA ligase [Candidatus Roizmanbacteria bacterium CG_4_9_14_0_2_um_filter_39_13]PJE62115.1 MAG: arginine--tRNA ligase [Candidatus Roizmanbacteria bacterium CG10_big_fil_rev_8_21_14_0_10_39_12]